MAQKASIKTMLNYYRPHAVITAGKAPKNPPAEQWGYVLGAQGEKASVDVITRLAKQNMPGSWQSYVQRCSIWLGRPVFDCNSLAEVEYRRQTGVYIDVQAKTNFASWCSIKDKVTPDNQLIGMPQQPGIAVFMDTSGPESADGITHVGFLLYKFGTGVYDWYVLECRGADYGLVVTKLTSRPWEWWGKMDKYFEYDVPEVGASSEPTPTPTPTVPAQPSSTGSYFATCSGNSVYIRLGRGTQYTAIGVLHKGDRMLALPAVDGWCAISAHSGGKWLTGYMSATYVKAVTV